MESEIKASLIALTNGIKLADGQMILAATTRLDEIVALGRDTLHPQLVHFLERRSYNKALMFLGGASDIPSGICGGGRGALPPQ
jgi:hypothetical protein